MFDKISFIFVTCLTYHLNLINILFLWVLNFNTTFHARWHEKLLISQLFVLANFYILQCAVKILLKKLFQFRFFWWKSWINFNWGKKCVTLRNLKHNLRHYSKPTFQPHITQFKRIMRITSIKKSREVEKGKTLHCPHRERETLLNIFHVVPHQNLV